MITISPVSKKPGAVQDGYRCRLWISLEALQDAPAHRLTAEHHVEDDQIGLDPPDKLDGPFPLLADLDRLALLVQDGRH